jgi:hypothetical protein
MLYKLNIRLLLGMSNTHSITPLTHLNILQNNILLHLENNFKIKIIFLLNNVYLILIYI